MVIDLKMTKFKPEFSGKMNFYLSAVDELLRHPDDKPSIGIILCRSKNEVVAEYALRDITKPVGVSGFTVTEALPAELKGSLPSVAQLGVTPRNGNFCPLSRSERRFANLDALEFRWMHFDRAFAPGARPLCKYSAGLTVL